MARTGNGEKAREARRAARRELVRRALLSAKLLGGLALCFILVWASREARSRVQADPRFDLLNWRLDLGELPAWAPEELRQEVLGLEIGGSSEGALTVFSPRVLDRVRRQLLECAWIREVPHLRLRYPGFPGKSRTGAGSAADPAAGGAPPGAAALEGGGGIELELVLRVPIALVSAGGAFYLTDREGVRVGPPLGGERRAELPLPAVLGGEARGLRRPPPPGVAWEDRDVREGLEVARVLCDARLREEFPAASRLSIDITNVAERARPGECEIVLSVGDLRLGWGRSPISPGARTLPVAEILQNLRAVLRRPRSLSSGQLVLLYTSPLVVARRPVDR